MEPWVVEPTYVDDIATVTYSGPNAHIVFSMEQPDVYGGAMQRIVAVRMIVPRSRLAAIGRALASGQERRLEYSEQDDDERPRLVN